MHARTRAMTGLRKQGGLGAREGASLALQPSTCVDAKLEARCDGDHRGWNMERRRNAVFARLLFELSCPSFQVGYWRSWRGESILKVFKGFQRSWLQDWPRERGRYYFWIVWLIGPANGNIENGNVAWVPVRVWGT